MLSSSRGAYIFFVLGEAVIYAEQGSVSHSQQYPKCKWDLSSEKFLKFQKMTYFRKNKVNYWQKYKKGIQRIQEYTQFVFFVFFYDWL